MATAEQNTLLGLQLFSPVAQQFNQQNDAKTALMFKLYQMAQEEKLKRDLADQLDARAASTADALQTREDTRSAESDRRQNATIDAAEKKQITAEMNRLYPQYAAAAAQAGVDIKPRNEFDETNEGLGQLAADLNTAKIGYDNKRLAGAADAAVSELDDAHTALDGAKNRLIELSKPAKEDERFARTRATAALKQAIDNGQIESATKLNKKAISDGLAALSRGDDAIAASLLGDESITAFQGALQQTLEALPNTRARLQERAQAQQNLLQLQGQAARIESDLRKGAATNPFLGEKLSTRRSPLQELMSPPDSTSRRSFDQITPPSPDVNNPAAPPKPSGAPANGFGFGGVPMRVDQPPSVGGSPINGFGVGGVYSLMQPAPLAPAGDLPPTVAASPNEPLAAGAMPPLELGDRIGESIRNMLGVAPGRPQGYAYDLSKLNNQLTYQNDRGQAETLRQIQQLLLRAQTDPTLAPQN